MLKDLELLVNMMYPLTINSNFLQIYAKHENDEEFPSKKWLLLEDLRPYTLSNYISTIFPKQSSSTIFSKFNIGILVFKKLRHILNIFKYLLQWITKQNMLLIFFLQDLIIFHFEIQRFSPFYLEIIKLLDRATTLEQ